MKLQLILTLFLFSGIVFGQEKINQFDANGNRTGIWKKDHQNGRIRYKGQFEAGKEVGVFNYYSIVSSDYPILIKTYSKDSDIATAEFFTEKGVLESEGKMNGKERIGKWLYYHPDGKTLLSEENYENGLLNGESKTYFVSGQLTEISHYKDGKLDGNTKQYSKEGILLEELNYKNGKLHGLATFYNINGKVIYTGMYENDEKTGKWEFYKEGKPVKKNQLKQ